MKSRVFLPSAFLALIGALILGASLATPAEARTPDRPVTLTIRLHPGPGIPDTSGQAVFHARSGESTLGIQLNATPRLGGETVVVLLGGRPIGRIALNARGDGRLYLSTVAGDRLPEQVYGLGLQIIGPHGIVVAAGRFEQAP